MKKLFKVLLVSTDVAALVGLGLFAVTAVAAIAHIGEQLEDRGLCLTTTETHPNLRPFTVIEKEKENKVC